MKWVSRRNASKELLVWYNCLREGACPVKPPMHSRGALLCTLFTDRFLALLTTQRVLNAELQVLKTDPNL
jgi:hypothetical protein